MPNDANKLSIDNSAPMLRRPVPFAFNQSGSNKNIVGYALGCEDSVYLGLFLSVLISVGGLIVVMPIVLREGLMGPFYLSVGSIPVVWVLLVPLVFIILSISLIFLTQIRSQVIVDRVSGDVQFQYPHRKCLPPSKGFIVLTEAVLVPSNKRWFQNGRVRAGDSFVFVVAIKGGQQCEVLGVADDFNESDMMTSAMYARTLADQIHAETSLPIQVNENQECTIVEGKASPFKRAQEGVFLKRERNRIWGKLAFKD